jgi:hypothetical protein
MAMPCHEPGIGIIDTADILFGHCKLACKLKHTPWIDGLGWFLLTFHCLGAFDIAGLGNVWAGASIQRRQRAFKDKETHLALHAKSTEMPSRAILGDAS